MNAAILFAFLHAAAGEPDWTERTTWITVEDETVYLWAVGVVAGINNHSLARTTADNRARAKLCALVAGAHVAYTPSALRAEGHSIKTFSQCYRLNYAMVRDHHFGDDNTVWALARGKLLKGDPAIAGISREHPEDWRSRAPAWSTKVGDYHVVFGVGEAADIKSISLRHSAANNRATAALCEHLWHNFHPSPDHGDAMPKLAYASCSVNLVTHEAYENVGGTSFSLATYVVPATLRPIAALGDKAKEEALASKDPEMRARGAWLLGVTKTPGSVERLLDLLDDDATTEINGAVAWSLGELGSEASDALIDRLRATKQALGLLKFVSETGVSFTSTQTREVIAPRLRSGLMATHEKTWRAYYALSESLAGDNRDDLQMMVLEKHPTALMRNIVLTDLLKAGGETRAAAATIAVGDRAESMRLTVAQELTCTEGEAACTALLALAKDEREAVRTRAYRSLLSSASAKRVTEAMVAGIADRSTSVQSIAFEALGRIHTAEVRATLVEQLKAKSANTRRATLTALLQHPDSGAIAVTALSDRDAGVVATAIDALTPGQAEAAPKLLEILEDRRARDRLADNTKGRAAELIGASGDVSLGERVAKLYVDLTHRGREGIATMAALARTTGKLGDQKAVELLTADLSGRRPRVNAPHHLAGLRTVRAYAALAECAGSDLGLKYKCKRSLLATEDEAMLEIPGMPFTVVTSLRADQPLRTAAHGVLLTRAAASTENPRELDDSWRSDLWAMTRFDDAVLPTFALAALALDDHQLSRARVRKLALDESSPAHRAAQASLSHRDTAAILTAAVEDEPALTRVVESILSEQFPHGLGFATVQVWVERQQADDWDALEWLRQMVNNLHGSTNLRPELVLELHGGSTVMARLAAAELLCSLDTAPAAVDQMLAAHADTVVENVSAEPKAWPHLEARHAAWQVARQKAEEEAAASAATKDPATEPTAVTTTEAEPSAEAHEAPAVVALAIGRDHTCALGVDGKATCWGHDGLGQAAPPDAALVALTAGDRHTCGLAVDGTPVCWGAFEQSSAPKQRMTQITAGGAYTCGLTDTGAVVCWGSKAVVAPGGTFVFIDAGPETACGIRDDGSVECWGKADGSIAKPPSSSFASISIGGMHACGVERNGAPVCWGWNKFTQATVQTITDMDASTLSAGGNHNCVLDGEGRAHCWGYGHKSRLAAPEMTFAMVRSGTNHSCGITTDGSISCWGDGADGQCTPPEDFRAATP